MIIMKRIKVRNLIIFITFTIFILLGVLFIIENNNKKVYVTLYNPISNTTKTIKYNNYKDLQVDNINGYEFIGWYYDNDQYLKIDNNTKISNGTVLKACYSKIVIKSNNINVSENNEILDNRFLTIKTENNTYLTYNDLKLILNKDIIYLDLKDAEIKDNTLPDNIFINMDKIERIILPDSLEYIGENSFVNCSFKEIVFGENLKYIGNASFINNYNIDKIKLPDSLKYIGSEVLSGCKKLNSVYLGENIKDIKEKVFYNSPVKNIELNNNNNNLKYENGIIYSYDYSDVILAINNIESDIILNINVKNINNYAFIENSKIKSIKIPAKIEKIGEYSFYNCLNLKEITFNNSVNYTIGSYAFSGCNNIEKVQFYNGLSRIDEGAFKDCKSLKNIIFTTSTSENIKNITYIGDYVFSGCGSIEVFIMPETVKNTGVGLFSGCLNLKEITLSSKLTKIEDKFCFENKNLTTVNTEGNITEIGKSAFFGCVNLEDISFMDNVKNIDIAAFENCVNIKSLKLDYIENIGDYAFSNCVNIENLDIVNVKNIGNMSFSNLEKIKNITFNKLESINKTAFNNCLNFEEINCNSDYYKSEDGVLYNFEKNAIICYPLAKNNEEFTILSTISEIYTSEILLNNYIKTFNIEDENLYFSAEDGILYNKDKTTIIRYPSQKEDVIYGVNNSVLNIGDYAFYKCLNLKELIINNNVINIGLNILQGSNNIEKITTPFIGQTRENKSKYVSYLFGETGYQFNNNITQSLKYIEITDDLSVESYEFAGCKYIQTIIINDNIQTIPEYTFYNCANLKKLCFKGDLLKIETKAFSGVENIEELKLKFNENLILEISYFDSVKNNISVIILSDEALSQSLKSSVINKFINSYSKASRFKFSFITNE